MKNTPKLSRIVIAMFAIMAFAFSAIAVSAEEDTTDAVPAISDGRVNSLDIASPIAIYESYDYPYADDVNMGVLDHIEFWALQGDDGDFQKVLNVTRADLDAAVSDGTESVLVASNAGYDLYKEVDGSLTLIGHNYQFNWTPSL